MVHPDEPGATYCPLNIVMGGLGPMTSTVFAKLKRFKVFSQTVVKSRIQKWMFFPFHLCPVLEFRAQSQQRTFENPSLLLLLRKPKSLKVFRQAHFVQTVHKR